MILQRLAEYYDLKRSISTDPIPPFGFSRERMSFELVLSADGADAELFDLRAPAEPTARGKGRAKLLGRWMTVPYRGDRSSNVKANFLWDNTGYIFGRTKSGDDERKRDDFVSLHRRLACSVSDPGLDAVLRFLSSWKPSDCGRFPLGQEACSEGGNVVFRVRGAQQYVHEAPALVAAWQDFFREDVRHEEGVDLVYGTHGPVAEIHFLVQGVKGAQPTGASLSSFNDTAYTSYGMQSSYNSPVLVENVFKYVTALRELLLYERRGVTLADATVIFWAERKTAFEGFVSDLLSEPDPFERTTGESRKRLAEVQLFLSRLREGLSGSEAIDREDDTHCCVLGLSAPSRSRLSVRFWSDSTVGEMKARLGQHMRDVELAGARDWDPPLTIGRIVRAAGRAEKGPKGGVKYATDSVSPHLAGAVARAVLTGGPYPQALLAAMIGRLRSDGEISHPRVSGIKGCIVRNSRLRGNPKEVSVSLDTSRSDPAYVTGRLFALLEKIQEESSEGKLNATVKDRYFSSASATPGVVFPRLIRLNQHHIAKITRISRELKILREKQLGEVVGKLDSFPGHFNLEEQGLFAIGYFHQRQDLFTRKDKTHTEGETE